MHGPLRHILLCHCEECRRISGYVGAFTATLLKHFSLVEERGLRWVVSPRSDRHARRGFCGECGSSLFWQPEDGDRISIAAGTLDRPTGLRLAGHFYSHHAGDYDELPEDGLPRYPDPSAPDLSWS